MRLGLKTIPVLGLVLTAFPVAAREAVIVYTGDSQGQLEDCG